MPFTRIYLGYPYDDAARMFRIDDGTVKLLGRERYRAHLKEAQEFAVSVLKVWLGLIPIWERLSRESHPPLPCAGQAGDHRPAFLRDHLWLKWHEDEGMGAAKIRDRWDAITDDERRGISPKIWEKVGGHDRACQKAGYEVVKRALKVAKQERNRRA